MTTGQTLPAAGTGREGEGKAVEETTVGETPGSPHQADLREVTRLRAVGVIPAGILPVVTSERNLLCITLRSTTGNSLFPSDSLKCKFLFPAAGGTRPPREVRGTPPVGLRHLKPTVGAAGAAGTTGDMRGNRRETPGTWRAGPGTTTRGQREAAGMSCGIPGANLPLGGPRLELLKPPTCLLAFKSRERWRISGRQSSPLASH